VHVVVERKRFSKIQVACVTLTTDYIGGCRPDKASWIFSLHHQVTKSSLTMTTMMMHPQQSRSTITTLLLLATLCIGVHSFQTATGSAAPYSITKLHASQQPPSDGGILLDRRSALASAAAASALLVTTPLVAGATEPLAPITSKVLFDVRISRQDGTFYVRDDLDDSPENKVFYGQLTLGLFGTTVPRTVQEFLNYVGGTFNPMDDNPLPSYSRSSFVSLDQSTGLLVGGYIPSLEVADFGGSTAIKYGGRVLPAPLWIDNQQTERFSHNTKGLLTHRTLDVGPTFGITTRSAQELDDTHTIFGQLMLDTAGLEFLKIVEDLPTYSMEAPRGDPRDENALNVFSSAVFNSQREVFRSAAKTFGDGRVSKVFAGKLLRRVEVTQVRLVE
jgi:cyclophilin family peptidyl-prolyl cis-trans isomerase